MKEKLFFLFFLFVTVLFKILILPYLIYLSRKKDKYNHSIPARFFMQNNKPLDGDGAWFHVCSYGEAKTILPLLEKLPSSKLRFTTITQTGHMELKKRYPAQCRYLPFEPWLLFWMSPQRVLVVMEAELWYMLFALSKKRGAKTVLINARISDASWHRYQRFGWLYRRIFSHIDEVYAQTELDKTRLEELGAKNIIVVGNIKLANITTSNNTIEKPEGVLVCAASTHPDEESLILDAFDLMRENTSSARLVLAPRHPERFDEVSKLCVKYAETDGMSYGLYSECLSLDNTVTVVDKLGLLVDIYSISDVVILGGAFGKYGGHNATEAAQFGCKIISGKHYHNQRDIFDSIEGIVTVEAQDLPATLAGYKGLPSTKIVHKTDLEPIVASIQKTMKERENATIL